MLPENGGKLAFELPALNLANKSILHDNCLVQVHSEIEEKNSNMVESIGQIVFGNVFLGQVKKEHLLLTGTRGHVFANLLPSSLKSVRPRLSLTSGVSTNDNEVPFIITCYTPKQLAAKLKTPVIVYGLLSFIGFAGLCAIGIKWWLQRRHQLEVSSRAKQLRKEMIERKQEKLQNNPETQDAFDGLSPFNIVVCHLLPFSFWFLVDSTCVICLEARRDIALLPCGHVCVCSGCFAQLPSAQCPLCRQEIHGTAPLFFS